jgi:hypothetical protein
MSDSNELEKRVTIEFPVSITTEEIENGLFNYLRGEIPYDISYNLYHHREKYGITEMRDEGEISEFTGVIRKNLPMLSSNFNMIRISSPELPCLVLFKAIKFNTSGSDSIEEFETLSTGKKQLKLIDEVRQKTEEYFSKRPK